MTVQKPSKRFINFFNDVEILSEPYGVVLVIGPWNYPLYLCLAPLIGAIAAGNCTILKPSELAPATSNFLASRLTEYVDNDCVYVIQGGMDETKTILSEKFDYIFFTGSTTVGRIVYQAAAQHLTPTTLELGGKSPTYLDDSVDIDQATRRIMWGKIMNSGQTCISPDYLLCTAETQNEFLRSASKILMEFFGNKPFPSDLSKIVTEKHFKRCMKFIENKEISIGGQGSDKENIMRPTILTNVKTTDPIMSEEIFGPILPIVIVENCDEAIRYIKEHEKPLALYVFSRNKKVQNKFLRETSSGSVSINDTMMQIVTENLPFGGVGFSGVGSYHGKFSFDTFSHKKSVLKTPMNNFTEVLLQCRYPPYSQRKMDCIRCITKKRKGISLKYLKTMIIFFLALVLLVSL
ncbi:hypothetical protein HHI36_015993, partial [Cryptolaemus montrouzieri]